jgi:hypothetical protein
MLSGLIDNIPENYNFYTGRIACLLWGKANIFGGYSHAPSLFDRRSLRARTTKP